MALSLNEIYNVLKQQDETVLVKIYAACLITSKSVLGEPINTTNHTERLALAKKIMLQQEDFSKIFRSYVVTSDLCVNITDVTRNNVIQSAVDAAFTEVALSGI